MKKVLTFVLIAVLVLGMPIPAVAQDGIQVTGDRLLPVLHEKSSGIVIFYAMEDVMNLSEEDQALMNEAHEQLSETAKDHLGLTYFCMTEILGSENGIDVVFDPIEHSEIQFEQYIDGVWTVLEHTVNEDGTISVEGVVNAPLAVFSNKVIHTEEGPTVIPGKHDSISATPDTLLPGVSETTSSVVLMHSSEMVPHMSEEVQSQMADAKGKLKDACPDGFAAKYFCYVEITGGAESGTVVFEAMEFTEIHFEQYVNGEWVELPYEINEDGTITVNNVQEGPKVIFIK